MGAQAKIRLMLALLCASLLLTAIIVQKSYTPLNNLNETAKTLEYNLRQKENFVNTALNKPATFEQLKSLQHNPAGALKYIDDFTAGKNIWFITLTGGKLSFWSGIRVIPAYAAKIKEGYSFTKESNGFYEVIKKSEGNFSAVFFIPVKLNYALQNQYLKNSFAPDLLNENSIGIADFTDKDVYGIHSMNNTYLFSVKLKQGEINVRFFYYELATWMLTLISFCVLVQNICRFIIKKGYTFISILFLAAFIVALRIINLRFGWPGFTYKLQVFDPAVYGAGKINPSFGDFCINIAFAAWFVWFLYSQRKKLLKLQTSKIAGYFIFIAGIAMLIITSTGLVNLFYSLVVNSKINFDVGNVLNLSFFSLFGVLALCFSFLIFFLLAETFLVISVKLPVPGSQKAALFIFSILLTTVIAAWYQGFTLFYILWAVLVLTRAYSHRYLGGKIDSGSLAIIILICALISAIKLNNFEFAKEKAARRAFVQKLEAQDDIRADQILKKTEKVIIADTAINRYFIKNLNNNNDIKNRLQNLYFNGYLSRYEFTVYTFDKLDQPLSADKRYGLNVFTNKVLYSSYKVSGYFYREHQSFGFLSYFAILPVMRNGEKSGTIVVELKSNPLQTPASFPGLLIDGGTGAADECKGYSYAFYLDGKLLSQSGNYVYDLENRQFNGLTGKYIFKTTEYDGDIWYKRFTGYSHLIYKPSARTLIVVTREGKPLFFGITAITFFFVALLLFSVSVILLRWLWTRIKIFTIRNNHIRWSFKINPDLILYKTRIQFSMVFAVIVTLIVVGIITFILISTAYQTQQDKIIRDKINKIARAFENGQYVGFLTKTNEENQVKFDEFANAYSADLTLFDLNGAPIITTEPKIYGFGLQATRMNARAFINLTGLQKSEYTNEEKIGMLTYRSAYVPIRNASNQTIAYLQLPYFSNESDYQERIGSLLNIMINVYAVVFMAIGLFAVFIAKQMTAPLTFIQYSLSKTVYGKKNELIRWDRNDEIGALVKEYNKMIAALEDSAQKLAQSERESAWREMAKQVAHEIKNPLTPLKLGLQLLDKSWKDKDPKFDQKFERFSKSFVEQIESLSSIATEFSTFAKMPETKLERVNIFEILNQAVTIFKEMDNVKIVYQPCERPFFIHADKDQLLRCFNNLLKNAIEATTPNQLGIIEINYLATGKNVLLTIKDDGEGIPETLREKIFEPNFTTKSSGTGLGLSFVKNSIENAGGKVWFETATGEGTTFYMSFPAV